MKSNRSGNGWRFCVAPLAVLCLVAACGEPPAAPRPDKALIRVGQQIVTCQDFEAALAIGRIAYTGADLEPTTIGRELRVRLLHELVEESLILEKARSLGIAVTPEELQAAEARIRRDAPEGAFEAALLKNAVDPAHWRERLRVRLLIGKTVDQTIGSRVSVAPEELSALIEAETDELPEMENDGGRRLLAHLRRGKIEAVYPEWISTLKQEFALEINQAEWDRLSTESPIRPRPASDGSPNG